MTEHALRATARRLAITVALGGTLALAPAAQAASPPDGWITTRAKLALWTASHVDSTQVHVDTFEGRVTLYGKVDSADQRDKSEAIARAIPGVKSVRNLLQVVPEARAAVVEATDERIQAQAAAALKADPDARRSSIQVKSVDKGAVLLTGRADSSVNYLAAIEQVAAVPGVREINSEVKAPDDAGSFERRVAARGRATAKDDWITTAVKVRLLADPAVPALDVAVDTRGAVVTLFGIVTSEAARIAAESDAHKVDGVKAVRNELQIVPQAEKAAVERKDDEIRESVARALKERPQLQHVDVDVKNGVARLTGRVAAAWQRLHAAIVTRSIPGVRSVDDDLQVKS